MPFLDPYFQQLVDLLDGEVSIDQIKVVCILVGAYPAALGLRFIRKPELRHLYNIAASLFIFLGVFNLLDACSQTCKVSGLSGQSMLPKLSLVHIYRQLLAVSVAEYDATGPEMVIVIKLTSLAYCIFDGQNLNLKEVKVDQDSEEQVPESVNSSIDITKYTPRQLKKAVPINKFPPLLEYFGFIFYFPSVVVGPAVEFEDYRQWATSSGEFEKMPDDLGFKQAASKLWFGFFIIAMSFAFGSRYQITWTLTDDYKKLSLIDRIWFVQMACSCARFRFYIVWLMSEGSMILSGLGYNGRDVKGNPKFDRVVNIDVFGYETSDNPRALIQSWNSQTDKWLKNYVYLRLSPPGKRPTFHTTFTTFAICAIWHGYYPGYYLQRAWLAVTEQFEEMFVQYS
ncbi:13996_t:CDS:2 [Cetraspora pellucida]|uniref:13996_t:CDS:1 n=1 Tax=Cetraspora pellucida TaxID=1433469 RepID=A0ACA9K648_9GLOM|nr:13996_t:CDS:2 [Cetraspora pellucida]